MKKQTDITVDEWQAEIDRLHKPMTRADGWISVTEFAKQIGRCREATKKLLEAGVQTGKYEKAKGPYVIPGGQTINTTVYRVKGSSKT